MSRSPMKTQAGQSVEEMAAQLMESKGRSKMSRLYPDAAKEVKQESLAAVVNQQRELLHMTKQRGRRIDLDNIDEVEECVNTYLDSCLRASVFPSMMGFAAASGWSRKSVYQYINKHSTPSARYLDNLRSSWAAIASRISVNS